METDGARKIGATAIATATCVLLLILVAAPAFAEIDGMREPAALPIRSEPTLLQKTGDLLITRPLLALRFVVNVAAFPIAWPVGAVLGDSDWAVDVCLRDPTERLFHRPLGRL